MVVDAVLTEPVSGLFSLFYREITGKICKFGLIWFVFDDFHPDS
ncbi:hypothetical protein SuNHUV7_26860 (plasmid) [Pseudoseohaeicola sp. NH-UV-7]|jgi:hypothetical protein